jgi:ubiquitin-activating enzyme E1
VAEQVKVPKKLSFKTFSDSLPHPYAPDRNDLDLCDWEKIGRPELLHLVYNALLVFHAEHNALPKLGCEGDADALLAIVKALSPTHTYH